VNLAAGCAVNLAAGCAAILAAGCAAILAAGPRNLAAVAERMLATYQLQILYLGRPRSEPLLRPRNIVAITADATALLDRGDAVQKRLARLIDLLAHGDFVEASRESDEPLASGSAGEWLADLCMLQADASLRGGESCCTWMNRTAPDDEKDRKRERREAAFRRAQAKLDLGLSGRSEPRGFAVRQGERTGSASAAGGRRRGGRRGQSPGFSRRRSFSAPWTGSARPRCHRVPTRPWRRPCCRSTSARSVWREST